MCWSILRSTFAGSGSLHAEDEYIALCEPTCDYLVVENFLLEKTDQPIRKQDEGLEN